MGRDNNSQLKTILVVVIIALLAYFIFKNVSCGGENYIPRKTGGGECDRWKDDMASCCAYYPRSNYKGQNLTACAQQLRGECPPDHASCTYSDSGKNSNCEGTIHCTY